MKLKQIFFLILSATVVLFTSCSSDDSVSATGILLDVTATSVEVGANTTLKATIQPTGASGTVAWATSDATVATVVDGVVTGVKVGTANIVASVGSLTATCVVTVAESTDYSASLKGSEYYPIILDGTTATTLGSKIKVDLRTDEVTNFLYIWDNTFNAGTSTGPNFYGEVESWVSLVVGSVGWSGAGFFVKSATKLDQLAAITANPDGYYLHIGIKSKSNAVFVFGMDGQSNAKFAVGSTSFNDNGTIIQPLADFTRDGEWRQIEIPMSTLKANGLLYSTGMVEKNIMFVLAGGVAGVTLDLDAVFIYKK